VKFLARRLSSGNVPWKFPLFVFLGGYFFCDSPVIKVGMQNQRKKERMTVGGHHSLGATFLGSLGDLIVGTC